jgi:hypothetical protein
VRANETRLLTRQDSPLPLDSRIDSERRALATRLVRFYAQLLKRPSEKPFLGTLVYKPAAGHYNSVKCFIVIYGYCPSVDGVGS